MTPKQYKSAMQQIAIHNPAFAGFEAAKTKKIQNTIKLGVWKNSLAFYLNVDAFADLLVQCIATAIDIMLCDSGLTPKTNLVSGSELP